ncbi:MAG TPA: hypothetical protein VMV69_20445 [Pirellulales bacterium]|nr:hypothetical protein [Pirellulales bacterium]
MLDAKGRAHLKSVLGDDRPVERLVAARTLTFCGEPADTVMPTLIELSPNGHGTFAELAWLKQVNELGNGGRSKSPRHRDPRVRGFAAEALGKMLA